MGQPGGGFRVNQTEGRKDWTGRSIYVLSLITLINAFNYFDRSILALVIPAIKADMQLSDTMLGLLTGLAFALFNSTLGIPIARLADVWNRRNIIAIGLAFWSVATALTGVVTNVWQLAVTRFLMGAGEASSQATSNSIIGDLFSKASRPMAIAIWATGSSIGLFFSPLAGWLADTYSWRATFIAAGLPGIVLAALWMLTVREPVRGASETAATDRRASQDADTFYETLRFLAGSKAYLFILGGTSLASVSLSAQIWHATFLVRIYGLSLTEVGAILGPVRGTVGIISMLTGGFIADRLGRIDERWRMWTPAITCALVAPGEALFLFSSQLLPAIIGLVIATLAISAAIGPAYAAALSIAKPRMRAVAISIVMAGIGLVGQAIGPLVVGFLNDVLEPSFGVLAIRYSLTVSVITSLLSGLSFLLGARYIVADARRTAEDL